MDQFIDTPNSAMNEKSFEQAVAGTAFETARPIQAKLSAIVTRANGHVEDLGVIATRYVSTAFCTIVGNAMRATGADVTRLQNFKYHAWGTSSSTESKSQQNCISLTSPTTSAAAFVSGTQAGSTVSYVTVATITADGSTTSPITEHCVHCDLTSGSYGLDRSVFTGIAVSSGDSIQFTYTLTIASDDPA